MSTFKSKRVLIVDGMNNFLRCVNSFDDTGHSGDPVGGVLGTLYTIGKAVRVMGCDRVIIVYDGVNNTKQRRKMLPDYKGKRRVQRDMDRLDNPNKEVNRKAQLKLLIQCFNNLPVLQFIHKGVEADDVIAYAAQQLVHTHDASEAIIMSSDKDFLQLVSNKIKVWSPSKNKLYGVDEVIEDFEVHPENMIWYRAFVGDKSDEIKGVPGIGHKSAKNIENIGNKPLSLTEIQNYATKRKEARWKNFLEIHQKKFSENVELMQLDISIIPSKILLNISERLHKFAPISSRPGLLRLVGDNGIPLKLTWIDKFIKSTSN